MSLCFLAKTTLIQPPVCVARVDMQQLLECKHEDILLGLDLFRYIFKDECLEEGHPLV